MSKNDFIRDYVKRKFGDNQLHNLPGATGVKFNTSEVSGELFDNLYAAKAHVKDVSIKRSGAGLVVIITFND